MAGMCCEECPYDGDMGQCDRRAHDDGTHVLYYGYGVYMVWGLPEKRTVSDVAAALKELAK